MPTSESRNGVLVVDKPANITSAGVVANIKKLLGVKKVGHSGALDPFATGVLLCCINKATKLARFFLQSRKTYRALLYLGIETDTQDATGRITATGKIKDISPEQVYPVVGSFVGEQDQQPPAFSALKHKGTPLYKLARQGTPVLKPPRRVTIDRIDLRNVSLPEVEFDVTCSAGTYIRTLCADIGRQLGCGGHLKALRRLQSGRFSISEAHGMEDIAKLTRNGTIWDRIIPMAEALRGVPSWRAGSLLMKKLPTAAP
ncbi:tRNA pseudouridine(55) synthase (EC [Olavius algarvensis associated proteobacterium Delta 3]|nr:tRNA pseudouridine(55) synthase (EC [Olavius algarvensis associated proteobacterium Delta 3]